MTAPREVHGVREAVQVVGVQVQEQAGGVEIAAAHRA